MLATRWSIATAGRTKSQTSTLPGPAFSRPPEPQTRPTRSSRCHCAGPSSWPPSGAPLPVDTGSGVKEVEHEARRHDGDPQCPHDDDPSAKAGPADVGRFD